MSPAPAAAGQMGAAARRRQQPCAYTQHFRRSNSGIRLFEKLTVTAVSFLTAVDRQITVSFHLNGHQLLPSASTWAEVQQHYAGKGLATAETTRSNCFLFK